MPHFLIAFVAWAVMGALIGWLTSVVFPGTVSSTLADILTSVVGAMIGGSILAAITWPADDLSVITFVSSIVGSILLLIFWRHLGPQTMSEQ